MEKIDIEPFEYTLEGAQRALDMGRDEIGRLSQHRELAFNAADEAAAQHRRGAPDVVLEFDLDREYYREHGVPKIAVIDTGGGMGEEMRKYLNRGGEGARERGKDKNFGVGFKIAALPLNPAGILIHSWKGAGHPAYRARFERDPVTGHIGLVRQEFENSETEETEYGTVVAYDPFDPDVAVEDRLPKQILDAGHGHKVTLLGDSKDEDTVHPSWAKGIGGGRYLQKYLNSRFFTIPEHLEMRFWYFNLDDKDEKKREEQWQRVLARTTKTKGAGERVDSQRLKIYGERHYLDSEGPKGHKLHGGYLDVGPGFWWWIQKDYRNEKGTRAEASTWNQRGHVGIVHGHEIYEVSHAPTDMARFGITIGAYRVVILVNGDNVPGLGPTARRDHLVMPDGAPVPWNEWGDLFRAHEPEEITAFKESLRDKMSSMDTSKNLLERFKRYSDLFAHPRAAKRSKKGTDTATVVGARDAKSNEYGFVENPDGKSSAMKPTDRVGGVKNGASEDEDEDEEKKEKKKKKRNGSGRKLLTGTTGDRKKGKGKKTSRESVISEQDVPNFQWVSVESGGRIEGDDHEGRAGSYDHNEHLVTMNRDFHAFVIMFNRASGVFNESGAPAVAQRVEEVLREVYQGLVAELVVKQCQNIGDKNFDTGVVYEKILTPYSISAVCDLPIVAWERLHRKLKAERRDLDQRAQEYAREGDAEETPAEAEVSLPH